jgi:hypothetical protein
MPDGLLVTAQKVIARRPPPRWEPVPVIAGEPTGESGAR